MLPSYWKNRPEYFEWETWRESEAAVHSDVCQVYDWMSRGLDALLERYGYVRQGAMYHTEKGTSDTIVFFCHFGATLRNAVTPVECLSFCALAQSGYGAYVCDGGIY